MGKVKTKMHTRFKPDDAREDARMNRGEDVSNWCRNCRQPFMAHTDGVCPPDENEPPEED